MADTAEILNLCVIVDNHGYMRITIIPLPQSSASGAPAGDLNQSQGEMRGWWGSNDGAGAFSKYG